MRIQSSPRRYFYILFLLLIHSFVNAADWTPAASIPAVPTSNGFVNVYTAFNSATNEMFAVWQDGDTGNPTYSIYTAATGWGPATAITTLSTVFIDVCITYNESTGQMFAAWADNSNNLLPTYSIYTPGLGWSAPQTISVNSSVDNDVFVTYMAATQQVMATWGDAFTGNPTYSIYSISNGWSPEAALSTSSACCDVFNAYNNDTGQIFAAWGDLNNGALPTYAIYTPGSGWSPEALLSTTAPAIEHVFLVYNQQTHQFFAAWGDANTSLPTYSIYTAGIGWSAAQPITVTSQTAIDAFIGYNSDTGQIFAAWSDVNTFLANYAIYQPGTGWSVNLPISTNVAAVDVVALTYNPATFEMFATWLDVNFLPIWSAYFQMPPVVGLKGEQKINDFGTVSERFNRLTWHVSPAVNSIGTLVYRNGVLVAILPAGTLAYEDHNVKKQQKFIYSISLFNSQGQQSQLVSIIL